MRTHPSGGIFEHRASIHRCSALTGSTWTYSPQTLPVCQIGKIAYLAPGSLRTCFHLAIANFSEILPWFLSLSVFSCLVLLLLVGQYRRYVTALCASRGRQCLALHSVGRHVPSPCSKKSRNLLLAALLFAPSYTSAACYQANSTLAPDSPYSIAADDTACFPDQDNSPRCGTGWTCLSDGVCYIKQNGNSF